MHNLSMRQPDQKAARRLAGVRKAAGYATPTAAAEGMGVPAPTYLGHENGSRGFVRAVSQYARFFKISADYLLTGRGSSAIVPNQAPVIMYIGAGAKLYPVDDHPQGRGLEMVEPPPGVREDCVAARIKGDSMLPLRDGWLIFWIKRQEGVIEAECIGQPCVCQVRDGPTLLKVLYKGSTDHHFTLVSWNASVAPPLVDVVLDWASPVIDIRPKVGRP